MAISWALVALVCLGTASRQARVPTTSTRATSRGTGWANQSFQRDGREGLDHVAVGAGLRGGHDVFFFGHGREHALGVHVGHVPVLTPQSHCCGLKNLKLAPTIAGRPAPTRGQHFVCVGANLLAIRAGKRASPQTLDACASSASSLLRTANPACTSPVAAMARKWFSVSQAASA